MYYDILYADPVPWHRFIILQILHTNDMSVLSSAQENACCNEESIINSIKIPTLISWLLECKESTEAAKENGRKRIDHEPYVKGANRWTGWTGDIKIEYLQQIMNLVQHNQLARAFV